MKIVGMAGLCLALCAATGTAQTFIKGKVVDVNGAPVVNADIDAFLDATGNDANLSKDFTDANGDFLTEFLDGPNVYDIEFKAPPGQALQTTRLEDVFVIGTVDLGVITLLDGRFVSGRVLTPGGAPLFGVDIDIRDVATGQDVPVAGDKTDGAGQFQVIVPPGVYDVLVDPSAAGTNFAPTQVLGVDATSNNVNVGDLFLEPGFALSVTMISTLGGPIPNADVDVVDTVTGVTLYTPGDSSDANGFVSVIVPAGTLDVELEPQKQDRHVALVVPAVSISANTDLGTIALEPGWLLSGTVTDPGGLPVFDVDVDAFDPVSGDEIHLQGSHTDPLGNYLVVLPWGTSLVDYIPPTTLPLASQAITTTLSADAVQDVTLADCPPAVNYGTGAPGTGGCTPTITQVGDPARLGAQNFGIQIDQGLGGATAFLWAGLTKLNVPGKGFTLLVNPFLRIRLKLSGPAGVPCVGQVTLGAPLPDDPALDGVHLYFQGLILDSGSVGGISTTDGLDVEFCR